MMPSQPVQINSSELFDRRPLTFDPNLRRNRLNQLFTGIAGLFSVVAVLPLFLVILYVLVQGGRLSAPHCSSSSHQLLGSRGAGLAMRSSEPSW